MKEKLASLSSVLTASLASICCLGPLLLAGLGAGTLGVAMSLARFRPYFIALTLVFLAIGFYQVYGRRRAACPESAECPSSPRNRMNIIILWSSTVVAVALILLQYVIA